jgi:membrane fusion protein, multidrug efflux system
MIIPQESTFEMQDKIFVFAVSDSNSVSGKPIQVGQRVGNYYAVSNGLNNGDKIVYTGLGRLKDGMKIAPQKMSLDSLIKANPL